MSMAEFLDTLLQPAESATFLTVQILVIAAGTIAVNFVLMRVADVVSWKTRKSETFWDDVLVDAARLPVRLSLWLAGLSWIMVLLKDRVDWAVFDYVDESRRVLFIAIMVFFALRFFKYMEDALVDPARGEKAMDYTTASAITKLLSTIVLVLAGMTILQTLGFSMSGVVAFGGVGGIAVGFAARDTLANFFGGLMIHMDHPFRVGDWVRSPDRDIEGVVEEIGWRLTTIRTFDKRPLYVPNAIFSTVSLENPSRMLNRRIYEKLGIRYQDWHRMRPIVDEVRDMLMNHEEIDTAQTMIVNFNSYEASHLEFFVYTFTKTREWVKFHHVKQEILLSIMEIIEKHGAEVAFPTRTLHLFREQPDGEVPLEETDGDYADYEPTRPGQRGVPRGGDAP